MQLHPFILNILAFLAFVDAKKTSERSSNVPLSVAARYRERARAVSLPANWALVGCFTDAVEMCDVGVVGCSTSNRALTSYSTTSSSNTPASCMSTCLSKGYSLSGVEFGQECYCGNQVVTASNPSTGQSTSFSDCSMACTGDSSQTCGAGNRIQIYTYTAPLPNGWSYTGCYTDDTSNRALQGYSTTSSSNTPGSCATACSAKGYSLAGVEYGQECYCANSITTSSSTGVATASSQCSMACAGNQYQTCGAGSRIQIYQLSTTSTTTTPATTTTTTNTATGTQPTSAWSNLGCYQDSNTRALSGYSTSSTSNTPSNCQSLCQSKGFSLAGVEYGSECYCGSSITSPSTTLPQSSCNAPCSGDSSTLCGGGWAIQVYSLSASTTTSTSTTPTATAGWTSLGCYQDSNTRVLGAYSTSSNSNTPTYCQTLCLGKGYTFAGTEYGSECYCGSSTSLSTPISSSNCQMACAGDSSKLCGGSWAINIYSYSTSVTNTVTSTSSSSTPTSSSTSSRRVIIQLFEWSWDSIAVECTQYIGPAGYGYVQVSPPQEHIQGPQWWTDYQPVSYTLTSKRGNRSQFQKMINTCHTAGVKVISDTIWNHMTAQDSGVGVAGTSFTHYSYPPTYSSSNFHYCGLEPNNNIVNYDNRQEVQTCQLLGLADLGTETEYVRAILAQYGNDLLSLGVDGFRLDAAKHIATGDIANILSRLTSTPYITQEVIWGAGEPITPAEYVPNGEVQEFRYTTAVMQAFLSNGISSLSNIANQGWVPDGSANVFVANHDTERNGNSLNYLSPSNTYTLAHVFMLAWPYGTPTVTSGYTWSTTDDGAPNGGYGTCYGSGGVNGWLCEHRWPAIVGLVGFRNVVSGTSVTNYIANGSQQIAFGRGLFGYVIINNVDSTWSAVFTTSLPDGVYCDVTAGPPSGTVCAGAKYTVSRGTFTASVGARSALALHTGAKSL